MLGGPLTILGFLLLFHGRYTPTMPQRTLNFLDPTQKNVTTMKYSHSLTLCHTFLLRVY